MKKYIIPAVEVTAMHHESSVMLTSFLIGSDDVVVSGTGDTDDASGGIGQLTNGYSWDAADWSE